MSNSSNGWFPEFTQHNTPETSKHYPGTLGSSVELGGDSTEADHLASLRDHASKMGGKLPIDIEKKNVNPAFPDHIVNPPGEQHEPTIPTEYIRRLTNKVNGEEFNNVISEPSETLNPNVLLPDLNALSKSGDPRWSQGAALQFIFQTFLPRIDAYTQRLTSMSEIAAAGGTQILNEYICTEDGTPIVKASLDAIEGSNSTSDVNATPPTTDEIKDAFNNERERALRKHADAFIAYVKKHYIAKGWTADAIFVDPPGFFFLKLLFEFKEKRQDPADPTKTILVVINSEVRCLKYYPDQKDYVCGILGLNILPVSSFFSSSQNLKAARDLSRPIPDYTRMD